MRYFGAVSKKILTASLLSLFGLSVSGVSHSYDGESSDSELSQVQNLSSPILFYSAGSDLAPQSQSGFDIFAPKQQTLNTRFDYSVWDAALKESVVQMGPSLRRFARKSSESLGSRVRINSRESRYRLEGSRVTFHYFTRKFKTALTQYKDDLVRLAHEHDIQSFDRNEQLAFWINLHNVVLIDAISQHHPTSYPSTLAFGDAALSLHEAKLISIKNIPLSLKDIREQIVYKNWKNPNVIYGFFRGDIGGPGIMPFAVTSDNVNYVLSANGAEYATSLRGFHTTKKARMVSKIYKEAQHYFFPNWPESLEAHLKVYYQDSESLLTQIEQDTPIDIIEYDAIIADLWGGNNRLGATSVTNTRGHITTPPILFEREKKLERLRVTGRLKKKHSVIIIDEETEDDGGVK